MAFNGIELRLKLMSSMKQTAKILSQQVTYIKTSESNEV